MKGLSGTCVTLLVWTIHSGLFNYYFVSAQHTPGTPTTSGSSLVQRPVNGSSCFGRCTESYFPGKPCYCNDKCDQYENCCFDYYLECRPELVWSDKWIDYKQHYLKFFQDFQITASQAAKKCIDLGGRLASVNDAEEHLFISNKVLRKRTMAAFIGGSDTAQEGVWTWADKTRMPLRTDSWHEWYNNEPDNNGGSQNCAVMTNYRWWLIIKDKIQSFKWVDYSCNYNAFHVQGYICERTAACDSNPCQHNGTCTYVGGQEEFTCVCKKGFLGERCQYNVTTGQEWRWCGDTDINGRSGVISSPLYPNPYPNKTRCEWTITMDTSNTVLLSIHDFELEAGKDCIHDFLTIWDGPDDKSRPLLKPACGNLTGSTTSPTSTRLASSGNRVFVRFYTDHSISFRGFRLSFVEQKCGQGSGSSGCGTSRIFMSECGVLDIMQGPLSRSCEWLIKLIPGSIVQLEFEKFSMPDTGRDCSGSLGLAVYSGGSTSSELLEIYCGERFPWTIQSSSHQVYLRLSGVQWNPNIHHVRIRYTSIDTKPALIVNPIQEISGSSGEVTSKAGSEHRVMLNITIYKWRFRVAVGEKMKVTWATDGAAGDHLQIFDGFSEFSTLLVDNRITNNSEKWQHWNGSAFSSSFQTLVVFSHLNTLVSTVKIEFTQVDWVPNLSGCYRPKYYSNTNKPSVENTVISTTEPLMIMVSERSFDKIDPGYSNGLYCKWVVKTSPGKRLALAFLQTRIRPITKNCDYDGVVIYGGNSTSTTKYGPFCGETHFPIRASVSNSSEMIIVFYSDKRGSWRKGGILRLLVEVADSDCNVVVSDTATTRNLKGNCGVVLSPNFPGKADSGDWSWSVEGPANTYLAFTVHYIRGPSRKSGCKEYVKISEVPGGTMKLLQYESEVIKLCGDVDVFIPATRITVPGHKGKIALHTTKNTNPERWEFKISYEAHSYEKPKYFHETPSKRQYCAPHYHYYRSKCYRREIWVNRHYNETGYAFLQTWQRSEEQCRKEGGHLLSIHDEDEAYFIKYMLAHEWMWDPVGTYQTNHRVIYLGLHNKYGSYMWTDGTVLGYSEWYEKPPDWAQPPVYDDTKDSVKSALLLTVPQPTNDVSSLCSVMVMTSPHAKLNWIKIPCDYPLFRAGMICKMDPLYFNNTAQPVGDIHPAAHLRRLHQNPLFGCETGWLLMNKTCYLMLTNYNDTSGTTSISYADAMTWCQNKSAQVSTLSGASMSTLTTYLYIWKHDTESGNIWLSSNIERCTVLEVERQNRHHADVGYKLHAFDCHNSGSMIIPSVLCQKDASVQNETCQRNEFACSNDVCVSADYVCDGLDDCGDKSDETGCTCGDDMFKCSSGKCISLSLYCDFHDDCGDNSDELNCVKESCDVNQYKCKNGECIDNEKRCNFVKDCRDGSDESRLECDDRLAVQSGQRYTFDMVNYEMGTIKSSKRKYVCKGVQCYSGRCLSKDLKEDLISDCPGLSMEDEIDQSAEATGSMFRKEELNKTEEKKIKCGGRPEYVECRKGKPHCYRRGDVCKYDMRLVDVRENRYVATVCRNGAHLHSTCESLECPGMFHCPGSYCIPYRKLCDGVIDCPRGGQDEIGCQNFSCPGLFRCKGEKYCISHSEVCDGAVQCRQFGEDEKYCRQLDPLCESCNCTGQVAFCEGVGLQTLPFYNSSSTRRIRALLLSHNELVLSNTSFLKLHWLGRLKITHNRLKMIPAKTFYQLSNLIQLNLSYNAISDIHSGSLYGLLSLKTLDLNNNKLTTLSSNILRGLNKLEHLILTNNMLQFVDAETFDNLPSLSVLNTDAYKYCCLAKQVSTCTPQPDEFSNCQDLMANFPLQISIWILGICAFVGNLFVVIWRLVTEKLRVSSVFIVNLGISDFFMGVYLLIIASVDVHYRGRYIIYADEWRASVLCKVAGMLSMLSSEVSVYMLTAITLDRVVSLLFPFKVGQLRMKHARVVVLVGWGICMCISILPAVGIPYFGNTFFGRTGVCLPFHLSNDKLPGWEYSVFIFLVLNLVSFLVILIGYIAIFVTVQGASKQMSAASTRSANDLALAKKLVIIVATDFFVPIILIGFAALGGAKISPQVSAWIAVFVLPLNSAVNPILYTISTINCRNDDKKNSKLQYSDGSQGYKTGVSAVYTGVSKSPNVRTPHIQVKNNSKNTLDVAQQMSCLSKQEQKTTEYKIGLAYDTSVSENNHSHNIDTRNGVCNPAFESPSNQRGEMTKL